MKRSRRLARVGALLVLLGLMAGLGGAVVVVFGPRCPRASGPGQRVSIHSSTGEAM